MTDHEVLRAILETTRQTHELAVRSDNRSLELYTMLGKHVADDAARFSELRQDLGKLRQDLGLQRGRVDSVTDEVEKVGKHVTYRRRRWDAVWRRAVMALVGLVVVVGTAAASYYFGTSTKPATAEEKKP